MSSSPSPSGTHAPGAGRKVALVHYWLTEMRGGEKVLEALAEMYPDADIFTHVYEPEHVSAAISRHRVITSFIDRLPFARRWLAQYLPLMPLALEQLDLRGYDLIISSESGPAKGIIPPLGATHICYCHSPMRYGWDMYQDYLAAAGWFTRLMMRPAIHYLRLWDVTSAARVDHFVANSSHTRRRIAHYYRRSSDVLTPPVELPPFAPDGRPGEFYLFVGQLTAYKRPDLAITALSSLDRPLVVIGHGEESARLRRLAGPNVRFLGWVSDEELRDHYARCRALVFPGEEDFGIVPVECMAAGRPVIALGRGGACDTVVDGETGVLFDEPTVESLRAAVQRFESMERSFVPAALRTHAEKFSRARFQRELAAIVDRVTADERA